MKQKTVHKAELCLSVIIFIAALFAPQKFNYQYCLNVFIICCAGVVLFFNFWNKAKGNFLCFEPIFILVALTVGFLFPLGIYGQDESTLTIFSWGIPYSSNSINKGAGLSALGILAFMSGATRNVKYKHGIYYYHHRINTHRSIIAVGVLFVALYTLLGGFSSYQNIYQGVADSPSSHILSYLEVPILAITELIAINECWNLKNNEKYKVKKIPVLFVIVIALTYLLVGNRTFFLYLLLPLIFFFSDRYYRVRFLPFLGALSIGVLLMIAIQFFRAGKVVNDNLSWFHYFADLLIPNTTTYLACEIVEKQGFTYGLSMLSSILGIFPLGQSLFSTLTGIGVDSTNSASIFSIYLGGPSGTGTSYISDSYLAFGAVGVFFLSYYAGLLINQYRMKAQISYYAFVAFMIEMGFAVYAVRASFVFSIRFIFYGLIFSYINICLQNHRKLQ